MDYRPIGGGVINRWTADVQARGLSSWLGLTLAAVLDELAMNDCRKEHCSWLISKNIVLGGYCYSFLVNIAC